ncbi:hypothetical protein PG989_001200 [Apiospora arundinis]
MSVTKVVAVRDDGAGVMNSLELGQSFTFNAKYTPPAALLLSLSIPFTEQVTLYLRFPPGLVSSLEKNTCNENDDAHPPYFDIIQRHLHNCRSFTRLQFKLHSRGQLITPAGFVLGDYDTKARHTFALVTTLAAALALSLYLPRDDLTNAKYQVFWYLRLSWSDQAVLLYKINCLRDDRIGRHPGPWVIRAFGRDGDEDSFWIARNAHILRLICAIKTAAAQWPW